MQTGLTFSTEKRNCVYCNKRTNQYKTFGYKNGIEIHIPICSQCEKEGRMQWCIARAMEIHLKGIQESTLLSRIISDDEKYINEIKKKGERGLCAQKK